MGFKLKIIKNELVLVNYNNKQDYIAAGNMADITADRPNESCVLSKVRELVISLFFVVYVIIVRFLLYFNLFLLFSVPEGSSGDLSRRFEISVRKLCL